MKDNGGVLSGYLFMLGNENVWISQYGTDGRYRLLTPETGIPLPSGFKVNGINRLEADCTGGEKDQAVSLVFRVNGKVAARATDSKDPLTAGTVALLAEAYEESKRRLRWSSTISSCKREPSGRQRPPPARISIPAATSS
jgi:hypothetical protein